MAPKRFIKTNFDLCTGCLICQLTCSEIKEGGYNPYLARLDIIMKNENLYHGPVVCQQCDNAFCITVCPVAAIYRDENGIVLIDQDTCVGCKTCVTWCPIGMARFNAGIKKAFKCDLCGGDPACVKACPTGALELGVTLKEDT